MLSCSIMRPNERARLFLRVARYFLEKPRYSYLCMYIKQVACGCACARQMHASLARARTKKKNKQLLEKVKPIAIGDKFFVRTPTCARQRRFLLHNRVYLSSKKWTRTRELEFPRTRFPGRSHGQAQHFFVHLNFE